MTKITREDLHELGFRPEHMRPWAFEHPEVPVWMISFSPMGLHDTWQVEHAKCVSSVPSLYVSSMEEVEWRLFLAMVKFCDCTVFPT